MRRFTNLFFDLENTNEEQLRINYLISYFEKADLTDVLWTIALLSQKRPKRIAKINELKSLALIQAAIPLWLFEETYKIVGDQTETISNIFPSSKTQKQKTQTLTEWMAYQKAMSKMDDEDKQKAIISAWSNLESSERFLFNKLITAGFRLNVSQKVIVAALSQFLDREENSIALKITSNWSPESITFEELFLTEDESSEYSKPYAFSLAPSIGSEINQLEDTTNWYAEYLWSGLRCQLIKREKQIYLWSREQELITDQFPEFQSLLEIEDDFVVDGQIVIYKEDQLQKGDELEKRMSKKTPTKKILNERPARFIVFDILEYNKIDIREQTQEIRRSQLDNIYQRNTQVTSWQLSEKFEFEDWEKWADIHQKSRAKNTNGLILKNKLTSYTSGRLHSNWLKWKLDPLIIDVVLLYVERGNRRLTELFSSFTFAVWDADKLVPITKVSIDLPDEELIEISKFVKANTLEKFGPVTSIRTELVFKISFEDIFNSPRHKSGVKLGKPKIVKWLKEKSVDEINTLEDLKKLIV